MAALSAPEGVLAILLICQLPPQLPRPTAKPGPLQCARLRRSHAARGVRHKRAAPLVKLGRHSSTHAPQHPFPPCTALAQTDLLRQPQRIFWVCGAAQRVVSACTKRKAGQGESHGGAVQVAGHVLWHRLCDDGCVSVPQPWSHLLPGNSYRRWTGTCGVSTVARCSGGQRQQPSMQRQQQQ